MTKTTMFKCWVVFTSIFLLLFCGLPCASASPLAKIAVAVVKNVVFTLVKWLWSLISDTETGVSSRSMMKFESGYSVETVFDGNKLGIEPHSLEVSPNGELLILDSENSNIYKTTTPLSRYSRPKLIAGSSQGYSGHVDGKLKEARMNRPKGLTMDDRGNTYIADALNMAIRKISHEGVMTTIAGGKWGRGGAHVDGPSEDAKFSNDFDVAYMKSSCSLLVVDRGNQAIREIQLHSDDCNYESYDVSFHLGIAVLAVVALFGYFLALLQRKVQALFSSHDDSRTYIKKGTPYQRKPLHYSFQQEYKQPFKHSNGWPMQESIEIPKEDELPSTPKKTYPFMNKELENHQHFKQSQQGYYNSWDGEYRTQQKMQMQIKMQQKQQKQMYYTSHPKTYYQKSSETNEIVFGAVQEEGDRREAVVIKAVDYGGPMYNHRSIRPRFNYIGNSRGY